MERRDFIRNCVCMTCVAGVSCAVGAAGAAFMYHNGYNNLKNVFSGKNDESSTDDYLNHVEIHLTEHCNLKCRYCSHFSSIAQEEYYDVEEFEKEMEHFSSITNRNVNQIQLLGGEPLLHPQVTEFFEIARRYFPDNYISIITNGTLLNQMNEDFWKKLKENNITLLISLYPIELEWDELFKKAKLYDVNLETESNNGNIILTPENIEEHRIQGFYKLALDTKAKQNMMQPCPARDNCATLKHGKLYPCFVIAHIEHLNSKFNQEFKVTNKDYLDIYKVKSAKEINEFYRKGQPFCKYCAIAPGSYKWKNSTEHSVDEWVGYNDTYEMV